MIPPEGGATNCFGQIVPTHRLPGPIDDAPRIVADQPNHLTLDRARVNCQLPLLGIPLDPVGLDFDCGDQRVQCRVQPVLGLAVQMARREDVQADGKATQHERQGPMGFHRVRLTPAPESYSSVGRTINKTERPGVGAPASPFSGNDYE